MSAGSRLKRGQLTESAVTDLTEDRNTANLGFRRHRHKHGLKVFSPRLRPLPVPANCCVNLGLQTKRRVQKNFCGVPIALPCARPAEQQPLQSVTGWLAECYYARLRTISPAKAWIARNGTLLRGSAGLRRARCACDGTAQIDAPEEKKGREPAQYKLRRRQC